MWQHLETKTLKTQNSTTSIKTIFTLENNDMPHIKNWPQPNDEPDAFGPITEILSPISHPQAHENNNLSGCTYSTLEKCRDLISNNEGEGGIAQNGEGPNQLR
jgi:hypothetical protein